MDAKTLERGNKIQESISILETILLEETIHLGTVYYGEYPTNQPSEFINSTLPEEVLDEVILGCNQLKDEIITKYINLLKAEFKNLK